MKFKYWIILFLAISLITAFVFIFWHNDLLEDQAIYVAIVGPMTGNNAANGKAMVQGAQLYFDQINQQGGINGKPIKLMIYDDQNQAPLAAAKAIEVSQSKAIVAIGHYSSSTSLAAAPIYEQYEVPAITASATADDLTTKYSWYFRIIFNNSDQGALIANYVNKILHHDEASVFFDESAYGSNLATAFIKTAKEIGLTINKQWGFNSKTENSFETSLEQMITTLQNQPEKIEMIFLATSSIEAVKAITELKRLGRKIPLIGADALASNNFIQKMKEHPQERVFPGYFSDGVYVTLPFLSELADKVAQNFQQAFIDKYQEEPSVTAAMYYDAAQTIVYALKKHPPHPTNLQTNRENLRMSWWQTSAQEAINGITGTIYFNAQSDAVKPISVGVYQHGHPTIAWDQYQPLGNLLSTDNLLQDVLNNEVIRVNGKFMKKVKVVYIGVDFNEVGELNTRNASYQADYYLWFRFKGDFPEDKQVEFNLAGLADGKKEPLPPPIVNKTALTNEELITTKTYHLKNLLKGQFDYHDYPLDKQILPLRLKHNHLTKEQVIYVVDSRGMGINNKSMQQIIQDKFMKKEAFSITGWKINKIAFFQTTKKNDSTWGLPTLFNSTQHIEFSQFNVDMEISRHALSFFLKNLFPTFILIILGYGIFFTNVLPSQVVLGANMILPTSLLHLRLYSELPNIDYFMLIEYIFYEIYLLALMCISVAILVNYNNDKNTEKNKKLAKKLQLAGKLGYPLVVLLGGIIVFYKFL